RPVDLAMVDAAANYLRSHPALLADAALDSLRALNEDFVLAMARDPLLGQLDPAPGAQTPESHPGVKIRLAG
ncbi:MAG: hypothetical protein KGR26_02170, partial [Cyanobacteria bacterium REEB65]|nr:hypothetical protein [Cyanobacteria bacterium REEB65]